MFHEQAIIEAYNQSYHSQVLEVWERSVLATHDFLSQPDFIEIKKLVDSIDFAGFQIGCLLIRYRVKGFVGVSADKIEMLFLDPDAFGLGYGAALLQFAIKEFGATTVDVNEQNLRAVKFYQRNGFEIVGRSSKDEQGREYPLLRMKLCAAKS